MLEFKEVNEKLEEVFEGDVHEFEEFYSYGLGNANTKNTPSYYSSPGYTAKYEELKSFGKAKIVHNEGGVDAGSNYVVVFHFPKINMYIRISGYYSSYDGTDYDTWDSAVDQVYPKPKVVMTYTTIKQMAS